MTVAATQSRVTFAGDNVSTIFDTSPVVFFSATDLTVTVTNTATGVNTTLVLNTHYTVSGGGTPPATGVVTLTGWGALLAGTTLVIERVLPETQQTHFVQNDPSDAAVAESTLDRLTMLTQQLTAAIGRCLSLPQGDVSGSTTSVGTKSARAGTVLGFDAAGLLVTLVAQTSTSLVSLIASTGATLIGWIQSGTGAVLRTVSDVLLDRCTVFDFMSTAQIADVKAGTYTLDVTAACQAALDAHKNVEFPDGSYKISAFLTLNSNQHVRVSAGATIKQVTTALGVFSATTKDGVCIRNDGLLLGPGVWSNGWTGNGGHPEEGVAFFGCTRSSVTGEGVIRNFGHAQVACWGGQFNRFRQKLEGTNGYGSALTTNDNFQMGFFCADDDTYGTLDGIFVDCDISGSAQGIVREWRRAGGGNGGTLTIRGNIHDIPGQHAAYIQTGNLDAQYAVNHIALSACKIACNGPEAVTDCYAVVNGQNIGSHLFEIANAGAGVMSNIQVRGTGDTIGGMGLSLANDMSNVEADVICSNATGGFQAQGPNQTDIRVRINGTSIAWDGVLITATTSNYKIWPTFRQCNTSNTAKSGLRVSSASATVDFYDPDVTDTGAKMVYGLFSEVAGSIIRVHGSAKFTGATDTAVRATGVITEWPTENTLTGTNGPYTSQANVYSSQTMLMNATSVSASNVIIWARLLDDLSAYMVTLNLVGKKSGSGERACYTETALFYRNGGVATKEGATTTNVSIVSAGFAGAHLLQVDGGNGINVIVNSGGANTYDWQARVTVTKLP